jgi:drug/metabolite transporter (DMT)-like permease
MDLVELVLILVLVGYSIYKQTQRHEVIGGGRFTGAILYAIIGLIIGGLRPPIGFWPIIILLISIAISVVVGVLRGRYTRIWVEDGRVWTQGTAFTIGLFIALVAAKFVIGTIVYLRHIHDDAGMGEILILIAVMIALNAEIVWRRGQPLGARSSSSEVPHATPA